MLNRKNKKSSIGLDKSFQGHSAKKFICPECRRKTFVRYYDYDKQEYLPEEFGRCDREEHCQYFTAPWEELKQQHMSNNKSNWKPNSSQPAASEKVATVEKDMLSMTMQRYDLNPLVQWLISLWGEERTMQSVCKYFIGTAKNKGTVYWLIDQFKRIRTCKTIFYNPDGHRNHAVDATARYTTHDGYKQCLFGEHLLFDSPENALVFIVESEKSALICDKYIKCFGDRPVVWLSSGGSNGLTDEKVRCLAGRDVVLVPDFSFHARATWGLVPMRRKKDPVTGKMKAHYDGEVVEDYESAAMRILKQGCTVQFYNPFPELNDGSDLADYLVTTPPPDDKSPTDESPVVYDVPDFDSLILPDGDLGANGDNDPISDYWNERLMAPLTRRKSFTIDGRKPGEPVFVEMDQLGNELVVEKLLNQPNILYLIEKIGFSRGIAEPIKKPGD